MDFNVKKLAADAGTFLSRAVQVRRRRLRTGRWRRGGRGDDDANDPACCWARSGAPVPPVVSASLCPTAARRRARRARTRPRASAIPDTLGSPRAGGLGAPAGEPGQAEHLCATPTLPLGRPRPPGRVQGGSFLFLPLCQLCSHQSLAARAGNGDRLSLSAPQLHQGRRKPGIRGALTHCPFGRGERRAGLVLLCPWSRWYFSGTLGGEEFTASPYSVIKEGNLGNRELGRISTVNT